MWKDPIVEEVRRARDALAARFDYDLAAMMRDLIEKQRKSGRKIIPAPPKRPVQPKG